MIICSVFVLPCHTWVLLISTFFWIIERWFCSNVYVSSISKCSYTSASSWELYQSVQIYTVHAKKSSGRYDHVPIQSNMKTHSWRILFSFTFFLHFTSFRPINVHTRHTCNWVSTVAAYFLMLQTCCCQLFVVAAQHFPLLDLNSLFHRDRHQVVVFYVTVNIFFSSDCHIRWGSR